MVYDLLILGAGAAGMMAAVAAGEGTLAAGGAPLRIAVLEKNAQAGIKVLVCGGGRCNLTNAGSREFLIEQFGRNGRFLTPALNHMDNDGLRAWFVGQGVPTHEEHDGKIYPDSNQARSVVEALVRRMRELGVEVFCGAAAKTVARREGEGFVVVTQDGREFAARALILAVGGMSYQRMGTTGDGYGMAQALGHTVVTTRPAIVGLLCKEEWAKGLQGLAVPDVEVRIETPAGAGPLPRLATGRPAPSVNDLLFTHFGLSGPAVLNPSEIVAELLEKFEEGVGLRVDFARHHTREELTGIFKGWQRTQGRRLLRTLLSQHSAEILITSTSPDQSWATSASSASSRGGGNGAFSIPHRLAQMFLALCEIPPEQTAAHLTAGQTHALVERIKASRFTIYATRGFKEAMVTAGGVALGEVDPKTMQSKVVPGLYLVGEVLDLTGPSGGYNLQLAFSTGRLAGEHAGEAFVSHGS